MGQAATAGETQLAGPVMTDRDFERVKIRIGAMAGIVLEAHKRQMIHSRLSRRLRHKGIGSFSAYLDLLDAGRDAEELQEFVNSLTTNLTSMFREAHHFAHLERNVLAPRRATPASRLRIWSAGCSSGEEPYSVALTALEVFGRMPPDLRILATDLDTAILARAAVGTYPVERTEDVPERFRRHLQPAREPGLVQMPAPLREAITFRRLNLLEAWPMKGRFDAIFCRNVMIYFAQSTKSELIDRFAAALAPGGYLYLGHSESILGQHPDLQACGETVYRRKEAR